MYITPLLHPVVKHIAISLMKRLSAPITWDFKRLQIASYQLASSFSSKLVLGKKKLGCQRFLEIFGIGDKGL